MRDLVLTYNGIFGLINKTAQIIAKTSASLQLSVSDMLTHANFPTSAMADPRYGGWYDACPVLYTELRQSLRTCVWISLESGAF